MKVHIARVEETWVFAHPNPTFGEHDNTSYSDPFMISLDIISS